MKKVITLLLIVISLKSFSHELVEISLCQTDSFRFQLTNGVKGDAKFTIASTNITMTLKVPASGNLYFAVLKTAPRITVKLVSCDGSVINLTTCLCTVTPIKFERQEVIVSDNLITVYFIVAEMTSVRKFRILKTLDYGKSFTELEVILPQAIQVGKLYVKQYKY